jgi:RNA polymerase sigma-70 factor (ECF subfamily)
LQPIADEELRQLMRRYQAGEIEAFEEIYARTVSMVRGYLAALTVDRSLTLDLVQDVYLQMHRSRQTYDPTRPVKPWVAGIARHVWLMARRSYARRRSPEVAGLEEAIDLSVAPDFERFGARQALARALAAVPSDQREAVVLHHLYGLSFREIARVAGISEGAARIRASRGMQALRLHFGGAGVDHG